MASAPSRAREGGEGGTRRAVPQRRPDPGRLGCDPTGCRGGTARSWPERGKPGDAEAAGHRSRLRKGNFQPKERLERLAEKLKLLALEGGREEKEHLCSWRKRTVALKGNPKASGSSPEGPRGARGGPTPAHVEESAQEDRVFSDLFHVRMKLAPLLPSHTAPNDFFFFLFFQEQIRSDLGKLKKQRGEILGLKISGERRCQDYLAQTEAERQRIVSEFRQLRRFLKDQELVLLAQLGELDREVMRRQEEEETTMSGQISLLDILICEVEKKLEQPASRFLQVGCSHQGKTGEGLVSPRLESSPSFGMADWMPGALWTGTCSSTTHVSMAGEGSQSASPRVLEQRRKFGQFRQGLKGVWERRGDEKVPLNPRVGMPRWETGSARGTTETFSDLERRLHVISRQNRVLRETLGRFQGTVERDCVDGGVIPPLREGAALPAAVFRVFPGKPRRGHVLPSELEKEQGPPPGGDGKAFVTLDPATANARLVLSRDRRGARWADAEQDLPTTPQRFDVSCCVLGCQGFTAGGTRCWEVEVAGGRAWALGVARRSVPRKGWLELQPEKGVWAMGRCGNRYRAFASPITTFPAAGETGRVRVALDYGGGQVVFYLAERELPIFQFQKASFGGEAVFPFFWLGRGSRLRLCP
ncbi:E3 ubiquitin-protein ligase TRIM15-like [Leptosomus discolor]